MKSRQGYKAISSRLGHARLGFSLKNHIRQSDSTRKLRELLTQNELGECVRSGLASSRMNS